ncbi:MAG: site-2 protease family protein [Pseudanabaena sp. ELA607]
MTSIIADRIIKLVNNHYSPCLSPQLHWTQQTDGNWIVSQMGGKICLAVPDDEKNIIEELGHISNILLCEKYNLSITDLTQLLTILDQADLLDFSDNYLEKHFTTPPKRPQYCPKYYWEGLWCKIPLGSPYHWLSGGLSLWRNIQNHWLWLSGFMVITAIMAFLFPQTDVAPFININLSPWTISLMVWGAILLITLLHELAHSLSLQHYGFPVSEWGIVVMLGLIGIYVDLSPSYHLVSRWQRLHVLLAGVWFQAIIAAVAWWLAQISGGLWQCWWHMVCWLGWGSLLWNLNPLVRTDGYYALVSWTQCWNLQSASWELYIKALQHKRLPWKFGVSPWVVGYIPACLGYGAMMISLWVMTWG